jgi:hypothetical protein
MSVSWDAMAAKIRGDIRLMLMCFASFTKLFHVRGTFLPGWFFSICAIYVLILAIAVFSAVVIDSFVFPGDGVLSRIGVMAGVSICRDGGAIYGFEVSITAGEVLMS